MNYFVLSSILLTLIQANCELNESTCRGGKIEHFMVKFCKEVDFEKCLWQASESGNVGTIKFLADEKKWNVRRKRIGFNEALKHALYRKSSPSVEALLQTKLVDPSKVQDVFKLSLGDLEIARILVKDGRFDPSVDENKLLSNAVKANDVELVTLLLADARVDKSASEELKNIARALLPPSQSTLADQDEDSDDDVESNVEQDVAKSKVHLELVAAPEDSAGPSEEPTLNPVVALEENVEEDKVPLPAEEQEIEPIPVVPREPTAPADDMLPFGSGTTDNSESETDPDDIVIIVRPSLKDLDDRPYFEDKVDTHTAVLDRYLEEDRELLHHRDDEDDWSRWSYQR